MRADWPDHPDVGVDEIAVLAVLSLYAGRDGTCYPSQETIAARLKRSRGWVIRVLNRLAALGLVGREQRNAAGGRRGTCLYSVAGHAEAVEAMFQSALANGRADSDDRVAPDRAAPDRVADGEHEQENPAKAGLSHGRAEGAGGGKGSALPKPSVPPEDWAPSPADRAFAAVHAPDVDAERFAVLFAASCRAHGYRYADHGAAFRAWLLNRWESPNADSAHRSHGTHLPRPRDGSPGGHRRDGASTKSQRPDARTAANGDTARAALALLAG
jgi:hypothetical protein